MRTLHRLLVVIFLPAALLAGCGGENVHGSSSPPEEFGAQATAWFGCPDMQGMYAWPPEMGEYANGIATNKQPWPGAVPVPIGRGAMQVWVLEEGQRLTVLSRNRPADGNTDPGLRRAWGYSEHDGLACRSDMRDADDEEIADVEGFRCEGVRRGFRLARMEDGALAVGIRTTAHGCRESVISWGDASAGNVKVADKVYWKWSKLRRIGDGVSKPAA
jgi:hypothetical protein